MEMNDIKEVIKMRIRKKISSAGKTFVFYGVLFLLSQCFIAYTAQTQDELKSIKDLWGNKNYEEAALKLVEYRKGLFKRNATVDYLLATCYCRIQEKKNAGNKGFRWILRNYNLDKKSKSLVKKEMKECSPLRKPLWLTFLDQNQSDGGTVGGKMYYMIENKLRERDKEYRSEEYKNAAITCTPAKIIEEISEEEFESRLFKIKDKAVAVEKINNMLESKFSAEKFKVESVSHFILASSSNHSSSTLHDIGQTLEKYLDFYKTQYDMLSLPHFITVYMAPDTYEMGQQAKKLHGLKVSEACIGYWFKSDFSIAGTIPGRAIGTLTHELFHLMVRSNFGDIPPWLDEGMAALYEETKFEKNRISGIPNWRGIVLNELLELQPSIENLVQMDWDSFNNMKELHHMERQAAIHATARYFIFYLQEKQKLRDVYKAFRDRRFEDIKEDSGKDAVKLLELILKKSITKIDGDFNQFFRNIKH